MGQVLPNSVAGLLSVGAATLFAPLALATVSGEPGFGKAWVRSHEFSLQALSWDSAHWDIGPYMAAGFNTLDWHPANTSTVIRPPQYAHVPWHAFLTSTSATGVAWFESLRNIPGSAAWIVGDEPDTVSMPGYVNLINHVRQSDPSKLVYSTLRSNYGTMQDLYGATPPPGYSYPQYVEDFIDIIKPDVLMYDHYPFFSNGTTNPRYLENLMVVRSKAMEHGLPYWGWLQAFGGSFGRAPSESDNRFNVYTHLTAGYTGLHYWTYDYADSAATYEALRDINGQPTSLYHTVTQTNTEVRNLGRALRFLTSTDVRFVPGRHTVSGSVTAKNVTPSGMTDWASGAGGDPHITGVNVDLTLAGSLGNGKDGLIGFFTDDSSEHYFMLTNAYHDAGLSGVSASLRFVVTFDNSVNALFRLNSLTGLQEAVPLTNHQLVWALKGGTGDLFKYTTSNFVAPADGNWAVNSGGDWHVANNWSNGLAPNGIGASATLGGVITSPRTVFADEPVTVGTLIFSGAQLYNLTGAASLSVEVASGTGFVAVTAGSHKINLPLTFVSDTSISVAPGSSLTLGNPTRIKAGKTVTKTGDLNIKAPLYLESGASLVLASGTVSLLGAPSLEPGAQIDVLTSSISFDYQGEVSPAAQILSQLKSGYRDGVWNGEGITSSAATSAMGLGWVDTAGARSLLVKYTWNGDTDLSGRVDSMDFNALMLGYGQTTVGIWANGDFNYDGRVNSSDFNCLAGNFGAQTVGSLGTVVPEPAGGAIVASLVALSAQRRRNSGTPNLKHSAGRVSCTN